MYHSITIGNKNTWTHWHLIPTSRPVINPPTIAEKYVEIPGRDGLLDLTSTLTGNAVFGDRKGSWEFYVMHDSWADWSTAYSTIMTYVHGKTRTVKLEDDPNYQYSGRLKVGGWRSEKNYSVITIEYELGPYKTHVTEGTQSL